MRWFFPILVGLVLGGLVHIGTLIAIPHLSPNDAYQRFGKLGADNTFHALATHRANAPDLPFLDPAFRHAVCRFALNGSAARIQVPVGDTFTALSFYNRQGVPFFSINERSASQNKIDVLLQTDEVERDEDERQDQTIRIAAPSQTGFVLLHAFVPSPSQAEEIDAVMRGAQCSSVDGPSGGLPDAR